MVTMNKLRLKMLRDLKLSKAQFIAVTVTVMLGVAMFIGSYGAFLNLQNSYQKAFDEMGMADYWVSVDYLNQSAVRETSAIPGIQAQGRIVGDVSIELSQSSGERIEGRLISLPMYGHPAINDVRVDSGTYFDSASGHEILVDKHFADYHELVPGDRLTVKHQNNRMSFLIAGIVTSPEYIWVSKSAQEPLPSPGSFGVFFIPQPEAEALFGMRGMVNEIDLRVNPGIAESAVLAEISDVLRRNHIKRLTSKDVPVGINVRKTDVLDGARTAYMVKRADQPGNRLLQLDLDGFKQIAFLFPLLFLTAASLSIYVLLNRQVESQRVQIGLLRAMGFSKRSVLFHYLSFAFIVGAAGSVLGVLLGTLLASVITTGYVSFLNIPVSVVSTHWDLIAYGAMIGIIIPLLSGFLPARSTAALMPAEAMRPARPAAAHRTLLEKALPFLGKLPVGVKLPMRNLFRNTRRSLFMTTGVTTAAVLILVSFSFLDSSQLALNTQFQKIENYDARIIFQDKGSAAAVSYVTNLDGVEKAEAVLEEPYRLIYGDKVVDRSVMGLPPASTLYNLFTMDGTPVEVSSGGVLTSSNTARALGAAIGDRVEMEPVIGTVGDTSEILTGIVNEPLGERMFVPLAEAQRFLNAPGAATAVLVRFDGQPSAELLKRLYDIPGTASIEFASESQNAINQLLEFFWLFIGVMLIMGTALGLAIIFNGVTINVLERQRELAVMRAMGMSGRQLSVILTLENLAIGILGIIIGIPLGYYIAAYFLSLYQTDIFNMNLAIFPRTYVIAILLALASLLISQIPAIRRIRRLNLGTVTKGWAE